MPGFWPRTRGGRKFRLDVPSGGEIQQLCDLPWSGIQSCQVKRSGAVDWEFLILPDGIVTFYFHPTVSEPISTAYDAGWSLSNPAAWAALRDRAVLYNGLGVRDGTNSRPPFSTNMMRYFGLDAYCPGGNPSAAFAAGDGNNQVLEQLEIWVGLYNSATAHYSNAVYAGTIMGTAGATGTITVSNLSKLKYATHGAAETAELFYVFYATADSAGVIPYLILNSGMTGPFTVPVTAGSASLSIAAGTTNGWNLNLTAEAPQRNFPPRPMKSVCYVKDRLYGVPMNGGYGSAVPQRSPGSSEMLGDFTYQPDSSELPAVVYSRAAGDSLESDELGDPLQSWPLENIAYTPNHQQPVDVYPSPGKSAAIVGTKTATFLLQEIMDGIQDYTPISLVHGITNPKTRKMTEYGLCWVTQRRQIVCLPSDGSALQVLSEAYQNLMTTAPVCADYLLDPDHDINRYEVILADGTSVIHDFALPALPAASADTGTSIPGQGYKSTGRNYTAANTATDVLGRQHHIVAKASVWTQEAQGETGLIPTTDENPDHSLTEINGRYVKNWTDFGDANVRKEMPGIDVIGDCDQSADLGRQALEVSFWADFEAVSEQNRKPVPLIKEGQNLTDSYYCGKPAEANRCWYKFEFKLSGHSGDGNFANHSDPATEGDLDSNFYGSIMQVLYRLGVVTNRVT